MTGRSKAHTVPTTMPYRRSRRPGCYLLAVSRRQRAGAWPMRPIHRALGACCWSASPPANWTRAGSGHRAPSLDCRLRQRGDGDGHSAAGTLHAPMLEPRAGPRGCARTGGWGHSCGRRSRLPQERRRAYLADRLARRPTSRAAVAHVTADVVHECRRWRTGRTKTPPRSGSWRRRRGASGPLVSWRRRFG